MADATIPGIATPAICGKCGSANFAPNGVCRPCEVARVRVWAVANPERVTANIKRWREAHRDQIRAQQAVYYERNRERISEETKVRVAKRRAKDPEAFKRANAERMALRRATSPKHKIHSRVSCLVRANLKVRGSGKGRVSWPKLFGYTVADIEKRLRRTIPKGYTWDDYLSGALHIDHIVPVSAHNFESPHDIDFRRCWELSNLRLLPKAENREKHAKLAAPFQPALLLETSRSD